MPFPHKDNLFLTQLICHCTSFVSKTGKIKFKVRFLNLVSLFLTGFWVGIVRFWDPKICHCSGVALHHSMDSLASMLNSSYWLVNSHWEWTICTVVSVPRLRGICKWLSLFMDKGAGRGSWMLDRWCLAWSLSAPNRDAESLSDYPIVGRIINSQICLWCLTGKNLRICKLVCGFGRQAKGWMDLRLNCCVACHWGHANSAWDMLARHWGRNGRERSLHQHYLFLYK